MALATYKRKRKFGKTPEPEGDRRGSTSAQKSDKLAFVIHEHHARRLHYDLRLEMEGVLKSWAVPKGPSDDPRDKRLAIHVEDHPFSYGSFEGVIPEGNYGAGKVKIWDRGNYEPLYAEKGLAKKEQEKILLDELEKGRLKLLMHGRKMKGPYSLSRMKEDQWLLIKKKPESDVQTREVNKKIKRGSDPMPKNVKPMLAILASEPFDREGWIFEIKWDGYRAISELSFVDGVKIYSRNGLDFTSKYPVIAEALKKIKHEAVFDGEIVAVDEDGKPNFQLMQRAQEMKDVPIIYYVFDLLYLDGKDLRDEPLENRRELLKLLVTDGKGLVRYSDEIKAKGKSFFDAAVKRGLEGIIAKDMKSKYLDGRRASTWLKIKSTMSQEAIICGFTEPRGSRKRFGALILGVYENDRLKYIGHTGGGFNHEILVDLHKKLEPIAEAKSPFEVAPKTNMPVTWVKPKYVCEVKFSEWTEDGIMRHPIYVGIRVDKKPKEVIRETAKESASESASVKLTNQDKIYFPREKITKGDIIDYYEGISSTLLPYLEDRPENLNRHPNGIKEPNFYQKDFDIKNLPKFVDSAEIFSESNDKNIRYIVCNNKETLLYMANLGCIEINPWNSRTSNLENPDYMIIDLDPGTNTFDDVVKVAQIAHKVLDMSCEKSFCKTSGKTGLHIYVPLQGRYSYDHIRQFSEILVRIIHDIIPEMTSIERKPDKRKNKIYLDHLQNRFGQTLCAPYSVRPTEGATVSTPLLWNEVKKGLDPKKFTIKTIGKRLAKVGDLWKPLLKEKVDLEKAMECLEKNYQKIRAIK